MKYVIFRVCFSLHVSRILWFCKCFYKYRNFFHNLRTSNQLFWLHRLPRFFVRESEDTLWTSETFMTACGIINQIEFNQQIKTRSKIWSRSTNSLIQSGLTLHSECALLHNYVKNKIRKKNLNISLSLIFKKLIKYWY